MDELDPRVVEEAARVFAPGTRVRRHDDASNECSHIIACYPHMVRITRSRILTEHDVPHLRYQNGHKEVRSLEEVRIAVRERGSLELFDATHDTNVWVCGCLYNILEAVECFTTTLGDLLQHWAPVP